MAAAAGVAAVEGVEAIGLVATAAGVEVTGRVATAAGVVGLAAQEAGLARARAAGVAAVRAAVVFARRTRDFCCRGGTFGSCDCRGAAAAFSVGDTSGRRPKLATARPRARRPGPAAAQSCCI